MPYIFFVFEGIIVLRQACFVKGL